MRIRPEETKEEFIARVVSSVKRQSKQYFLAYRAPMRFGILFSSWAAGASRHCMSLPELAEVVIPQANLALYVTRGGKRYVLPSELMENEEIRAQTIDVMLASDFKTYEPELL